MSRYFKLKALLQITIGSERLTDRMFEVRNGTVRAVTGALGTWTALEDGSRLMNQDFTIGIEEAVKSVPTSRVMLPPNGFT